MFERGLQALGGVLRIPSAPASPLGDPASVQVFRAAVGYYRYRLLGWAWHQLYTIVGLIFGFLFLRYGSGWIEALGDFDQLPDHLLGWWGGGWWHLLEVAALIFFFVQLPISWLWTTLDYRSRWYVVSDRSLRIREGLWQVREQTMTFSNVQNLAIRQGPVQRLFGIADLEVTSAGGGGAKAAQGHGNVGRDLHVGYFRGVANAAEIRGTILQYLRQARAAGLGDADPAVAEVMPATGADPTLAAAREMLRQARGLVQELD